MKRPRATIDHSEPSQHCGCCSRYGFGEGAGRRRSAYHEMQKRLDGRLGERRRHGRGRPRGPRPLSEVELEYPTDNRMDHHGHPRWRERETPRDTHKIPERAHQDHPSGPSNGDDIEPDWPDRLFRPRPLNEYEALMQCVPRQEPEPSVEEVQAIREALGDAIDDLDAELTRVFEAYFIERRTLETIAIEMGYGDGDRGKSNIRRRRDKARSIVESHHGRMQVQNIYNGDEVVGCCFSFWIPVQSRLTQEPEPGASAATSLTDTERAR